MVFKSFQRFLTGKPSQNVRDIFRIFYRKLLRSSRAPDFVRRVSDGEVVYLYKRGHFADGFLG